MANYNGLRISMNTFIEDNFSDYTIVFDENFADPETFEAGAKWITPVYGPCSPDTTVKEIELFIICFAKGDTEGLEASKMVDKVLSSFDDPTMPDGNKRIPFYVVQDGTRVVVSSIFASDTKVLDSDRLGDSTTVLPVKIRLQWC